MDEVWERAVETALGQTDSSSTRSLTLDGSVKCYQGRLPPPSLLEKFQSLEHLSIANVGVSSLEKFPRLRNLQKLILSDNRIASGLEFLVEAGLESLRDLDLSNNRIQSVEDLAPLAQLKLVSLDLYECPVTRIGGYRSRVFGLIRTLKYLDKMDVDENERPESDEEDEEDEEEDDPGSGEIDGEERNGKTSNGRSNGDGVVDVDEDEESDAAEETENVRVVNGSSQSSRHQLSNGFRVDDSIDGDEDDEDVEEEDDHDDDLGEEVYEEEGEDEDVVEVHEIDDSGDEEDGIEEDEDDEDGDENEEEEVDDEEEDPEHGVTRWLTSADGEIDGHDQGEEDENGEIGEEDQGIGEDAEDEEDEDDGTEFLVQPIGLADGGSDLELGNRDEGDSADEEDVEDGEEEKHGKSQLQVQPFFSESKRKRDEQDDDHVVNVKSRKPH